MISDAELLNWTKAEAADTALLRSLEQAAVAYLSRLGRYWGEEDSIVEEIPWYGGSILQLANESTDLVLEEWDGTAWATVAADRYVLSGRLLYMRGGQWRATRGRPVHLRATYTAGYTPDAGDADVWDAPDPVKQAVRMLVMNWWAHRGDDGDSQAVSAEVELGVRAIMAAYQ